MPRRERFARAAERVALYHDADPSNDPPVVGASPEVCLYCHHE